MGPAPDRAPEQDRRSNGAPSHDGECYPFIRYLHWRAPAHTRGDEHRYARHERQVDGAHNDPVLRRSYSLPHGSVLRFRHLTVEEALANTVTCSLRLVHAPRHPIPRKQAIRLKRRYYTARGVRRRTQQVKTLGELETMCFTPSRRRGLGLLAGLARGSRACPSWLERRRGARDSSRKGRNPSRDADEFHYSPGLGPTNVDTGRAAAAARRWASFA